MTSGATRDTRRPAGDLPQGGPLQGLTIIELAGIGPGPYAAMLLADMGADVIRVERPGDAASGIDPEIDVLRRNRRSIAIDLRSSDGVEVLKGLAERADALIEGFRPGVTERLGIGPDDLWKVNPRLVYGRMTGWGQSGPLASTAGHDIDYIALTGALGAIGRSDDGPVPPLNFVGDFGGGSLFLVMGVLAALHEAARTGQGQVVDAAIVDGAASFTGILHSLMASGKWSDERGRNFLDGGVPWYDTYETADGRWMAVGCLEPQFYAVFVDLLGIPDDVRDRTDPRGWTRLRKAIADAFAQRTQEEWTEVFSDTDACVAPVLSLLEAPSHPHLRARQTFVDVDGVTQPAAAPRFSNHAARVPVAPRAVGADTVRVLQEFGFGDIDRLLAEGVIVDADDAGRSA